MSRLAAWMWLLTIAVLAVGAWSHQTAIDTSMMSLLPASQQQPLVKATSEQMGRQFSQRMLILVDADNKKDRQSAVKQLAKAYEQVAEVESVLWKLDSAQVDSTQQALFSYRYVLLSDAMSAALSEQKTQLIREQALSRILNPVSLSQLDLVSDPFGLMQGWQSEQRFSVKIELENDYLKLTEAPTNYLLVLNLAEDAFSMKTQKSVLSVFQLWQQKLKPQGVQLRASGLLIHADAGAKQAQWEMSTIGAGSLIGIMLLMWWVFRSVVTVLTIFLPIAIGCVVATSVVFLVFDRVHIVTFAFGAGLVGVAVDYALHYVCEQRVRQNVLQHILPGLTLGLVSSVLAYAAQAITPFPGLRQMAVFSVSGLIAAWLTVVLWFPTLMKDNSRRESVLGNRLMQWQASLPNIGQQRWLSPLLCLLGSVALAVIVTGKTVDDIRLLQTSPPALIKQESQIHQLLGLNSSTQFLMVSCEQLEGCLQREEQLKPLLLRWRNEGKLSQYQMLSTQLPSQLRQHNNAELVAKLYNKELLTLFQSLHLPEQVISTAQEKLAQDLNNRLGIEQLQTTSLVQVPSIVRTEQNGIATVISFNANAPLSVEDLSEIHQRVDKVSLIDQVDAISSVMKDYRQQMMIWVALAYLLLMLILVARYKLASWRIILPPLLASVFTLSILLMLLPGINLFHIMALILVLGIGIDMGIFLTETQQAQQTWLAVSLSVATSLMAFGLLALSHTPVLKHFGLTVLLGLSCVWIVTNLIRLTSVSRSEYIAGS